MSTSNQPVGAPALTNDEAAVLASAKNILEMKSKSFSAAASQVGAVLAGESNERLTPAGRGNIKKANSVGVLWIDCEECSKAAGRGPNDVPVRHRRTKFDREHRVSFARFKKSVVSAKGKKAA